MKARSFLVTRPGGSTLSEIQEVDFWGVPKSIERPGGASEKKSPAYRPGRTYRVGGFDARSDIKKTEKGGAKLKYGWWGRSEGFL